jgi:hypothetical protein
MRQPQDTKDDDEDRNQGAELSMKSTTTPSLEEN